MRNRRPIRELTLAEFLELYPPMAGGSPDDPETETEEQPEPTAERKDEPSKSKPEPKDDPKPDDDMQSISRAELQALRRKLAEAEKDKRAADREKREQEEERQRQQGEYQQLAESKAQEAADLRKQLDQERRDTRVTAIARRLNFHDPQDVVGRLTSEEADDDTLAETALERIAERSPHLVKRAEKPKPEIGRVMEPAADAPAGTENGGRKKDAAYYEQMTAGQLADLPADEHKRAIRLLAGSAK